MSSYDRAVRFPRAPQRTGPRVGPSSYYLPDQCDQPGMPHAPFLSSCPRTDARLTRARADLPCAADYDVTTYRARRVTGGAAMAFKDSRFKERRAEGPGPGDYAIRNQRETRLETERSRKKGKGKLFQCRVPYQIGASPPSIPHRTHCHGYEIDKLGGLVPNPPSDHDLSLGPAFYETLDSPKPACQQYKGARWCASQTRRTFFEPREGPGPGAYEVGVTPPPDPAKLRDKLVRFEKRKCSKQPRLAEMIEQRTVRENLPGPGYYDILPVPHVNKRRRRRFCGFLSSKERFTYVPDENPAPGTYELTSGICRWKPGSVKSTGFLMDAERFPRAKGDNLPGPADYTQIGQIEGRQLKQAASLATRVPGFDSCTERTISFLPKDAALAPAPNQYDPQPARCVQSACSCSAVFKSRVPRWHALQDNGQASCASYDVAETHRKLMTRQSHRKVAEGKQSRFASSVGRFGPITDVVYKRADPSMPGPADYRPDADATVRRRDAGTWGTAERFEYRANGFPGPAHYKLHLKERESTLKGTYNSTLGNPLPNPLSSVKPWLQNPAAKRRMRWFLDDVDHCQPLICCRSTIIRHRR